MARESIAALKRRIAKLECELAGLKANQFVERSRAASAKSYYTPTVIHLPPPYNDWRKPFGWAD